MNLRNGLYGLHQNSNSNTTNSGKRSFSVGKYMSNTSDWTLILGFAVTTMPSQFNMGFYWHCDSMRDSGNGENRTAVKTAVAGFNGYSWTQDANDWEFVRGNGINYSGQMWRNGFNTIYLRDYAWAGSPIYVTYHIDVLCSNWDKINVNYV